MEAPPNIFLIVVTRLVSHRERFSLKLLAPENKDTMFVTRVMSQSVIGPNLFSAVALSSNHAFTAVRIVVSSRVGKERVMEPSMVSSRIPRREDEERYIS
jgi:hypothetical protein